MKNFRSFLQGIAVISSLLAVNSTICEDVPSRDQRAKDIAVYLAYTRDHISDLKLKIEQLENKASTDYDDQQDLASLKDSLKIYIVANLISEGNIEALEKMPREQLQFYDGQIEVEGKLFDDAGPGYLVSRAISGRNALAFVLFHSVLDKTQTDKDKTLAMLQVLLHKKLNPNARTGELLWVSKSESSTTAWDYIRHLWLREVAAKYSFPEAQALLEKYSTPKTVITKLENNLELETEETITDDAIIIAQTLYFLQGDKRDLIGYISYANCFEFAPHIELRLPEQMPGITLPFKTDLKNMAMILVVPYVKPAYRGQNFARMLINLTSQKLFENKAINSVIVVGPFVLFEESTNDEVQPKFLESTPEYKTREEQIIRLFESCGFHTIKANDKIILYKINPSSIQ